MIRIRKLLNQEDTLEVSHPDYYSSLLHFYLVVIALYYHIIHHNRIIFQANYKMQAIQLQKDIAELKRRLNNAKFRLDTEIKV